MNKPVAWMFQGAFDISTYVSFEKPNPDIYPNPTPLYTHPVKEQDAVRYQWLRNEFAHGRETYLAEGMPSGESLDKYIDEQLRKAQEAQ
jgi:hypothetical protein